MATDLPDDGGIFRGSQSAFMLVEGLLRANCTQDRKNVILQKPSVPVMS